MQTKKQLPTDLINIISEYNEGQLRSWIQQDINRLNCEKLSINPNLNSELIDMIEYGCQENPKYLIPYLMLNPSAISLIERFHEYLTPDDWDTFTMNPNATRLLEKKLSVSTFKNILTTLNIVNPNNIVYYHDYLSQKGWNNLASNPNGMTLLKSNLEKLSQKGWDNLASNPNGMTLLKSNLEKLSQKGWDNLASNPRVSSLINQEKLFEKLLSNMSPKGNHNFLINPDSITLWKKYHILLRQKGWDTLACNPNGIKLLEQVLTNSSSFVKLSKTGWDNLACNPNGVSLLESNLEKMSRKGWDNLACNPNGVSLLESNLEKLSRKGWENLACNPNGVDIVFDNLRELSDMGWVNFLGNKNIFKILKSDHELYKLYQYVFLRVRDHEDNKMIFSTFSTNPHIEVFLTYIMKNEDIKRKKNHPMYNIGLDQLLSENISKNPWALNFLKEHQLLVDWEYVSMNPGIVESQSVMNILKNLSYTKHISQKGVTKTIWGHIFTK